MNLSDWFNEHKDITIRRALAARADTSLPYLLLCANGSKTPGANLCAKLLSASMDLTPNSIILPSDVRPDLALLFACHDPDERKAS